MQIFLDSANYREIEHWLEQGVVDGVTTNPSIMLKDGVYDIEEGARRLCTLLGKRPVSLEVTTNDHSEMMQQARAFASWASNVVVKIPVVNEHGESCLGVISRLTCDGVSVNCTAILSFNQAMLATKAGATYVSIFGGRIADEGNDPTIVIRNVRQWLDGWGQSSKIIVGSIRTVLDIQSAALAGAHIVTIPPQFLPKMVDHKYTRDTVRQFNRDAQKALVEIFAAQTVGETSAKFRAVGVVPGKTSPVGGRVSRSGGAVPMLAGSRAWSLSRSACICLARLYWFLFSETCNQQASTAPSPDGR